MTPVNLFGKFAKRSLVIEGRAFTAHFGGLDLRLTIVGDVTYKTRLSSFKYVSVTL